jgi:hypothetical protein
LAVERRDAYCSQAEHSRDCELHPFDCVPRQIFLDTSVVNAMVKYAPQVFEQQSLDPSLERVIAEDVESLMHIVAISGRGPWELVSSRAMLEEISQTPSEETRNLLLGYAVELVDVGCKEDELYRENFARHLAQSSVLQALPDIPDRRLLSHAMAMRCDTFCTRDRATIILKRSLLPTMTTRILTPREWWESLRPWAALFA